MKDDRTTAAIQGYLNELAGVGGASSAEPVIGALLARAVRRLHLLCATLLHRSYPRLSKPPLNLESDEVLSAVVERLLKALRKVRPPTVRQFFALATQHMRWELNGLARNLDARPTPVELSESTVPQAPVEDGDDGPGVGVNTGRILDAIGGLPADEREAFDLVRIQGLSPAEAANVIGVSYKTVQRRLNRSVLLLTEKLGDLKPAQALREESVS
jgi:RNA polymerase sigma factor (sigma-70 family)